MKDSIQNDKPAEPDTVTDRTHQLTAPEQRTQPTPSGKGVFLLRAKGQSFEEFKKVCIQRFREAGLIKD